MVRTRERPDVMTIPEVAEFLRVPEATVRRYATRFAIPGRQLGKEWRFSRLALEDWLRSASGKEILLSQAGAFADDMEDLEQLRAAIYRNRGRSEVEERE